MPSIYDHSPQLEGPLAGVRVLDVTAARAGPTSTRQLADLGADVIQVWQPGKADLMGSDYANLHHNKRSIVIDLLNPDGYDVFCTLARSADVLVENSRPNVKHKLRIDPERMSALNPRLIYASISGFGQEGPYADRPGVDPIAQGYSGLMSVTGPPGAGPWRAGIAISDTGSGMFLTQGILAALYARERTGKGQWIHTSLVESLINMMDFQAVRWLVDKVVPEQAGNDHPTIYPFGAFRTKDGVINLGSTNYRKFCELLGLTHLVDDPRFDTGAKRYANRRELQELVEEVLTTRSSEEWVDIIGDQIPCGPVLSMNQVFEDAQARHLQLTRKINHPAMGDIDVLRYPVTFSDTPAANRRGVVTLGGDAREILAEAGYEDERIEALIATGAVATSSKGAGW
jgi:crotonobetainyl-CoA:carnitine CoA-transferase CaiB-like acyl-CoA transferase